ncbi:putative anaphase-promoting complex component cut20 [Diplodia seriata]|uniref:Anaphase-promoting complex subunit 4 n=1 Tax=Diplodia seriata TaxID=420778 RepID=A0A0G2DZ86_9PEZI|nr:putative anaphase-promoting complex component cut20 [Diplodia seriata]
MEPPEAPSLMLQAEKALPQPVRPRLISYCPTMDLVAVITQEETLDVYRLNGQRAFGLKRKTLESKVDSMCWKFNGQHIAVAWDDGSVDIVSSETGKTVKQVRREAVGFAADDESPPRISSLAWGVNFIDVAAVKERTGVRTARLGHSSAKFDGVFDTTEEWDQKKEEVTLDDFLERQPDLAKLGLSPDLPDQIALIDVQDALPKLPLIPAPPANPFQMMAKAKATDAFSSQQSIDAIFHSQHMRDSNAGHKRWDQAASQGYTKVLEITHENIIPALDRTSIVELEDSCDISTYLVLVPQEAKSEVRLHRIVHCDVFNSITNSVRSMQAVTVKFKGCEIVDIKFVDDSTFMALLRRDVFVKHVFPSSERFTPVKIDINGRKDRRVVCVLGNDLKHYKVYDLDYDIEKEGEGDTTVDTIMSG